MRLVNRNKKLLLLFRHGIRELEAFQQLYSRVGRKSDFLASVSNGGQQHVTSADVLDIKTVKTGHKSVFIMCSYYSQDSQTSFRFTRNVIFQYIYIE